MVIKAFECVVPVGVARFRFVDARIVCVNNFL